MKQEIWILLAELCLTRYEISFAILSASESSILFFNSGELQKLWTSSQVDTSMLKSRVTEEDERQHSQTSFTLTGLLNTLVVRVSIHDVCQICFLCCSPCFLSKFLDKVSSSHAYQSFTATTYEQCAIVTLNR